MEQEKFYFKYHVKQNSIIPTDFNMIECRNVFTKLHNEKYADKLISSLLEYMHMPEQYEGFYPPQKRIIFYNTKYITNFQKLGLQREDIETLGLDITQNQEKIYGAFNIKESHFSGVSETQKDKIGGDYRLQLLVAKVGPQIYLSGLFGDCGSFGCMLGLDVKEGEEWKEKKINSTFDCYTPDEKKDDIYYCDIHGGLDWAFRSDASDYEPLQKLLDRYDTIYQDYINTYIQKK